MNLNFGRFAVSDMRPTPEVGGAISSKIQGHHRPTDASKLVKRVTLPEKVDEIPPFHGFHLSRERRGRPAPTGVWTIAHRYRALCALPHTPRGMRSTGGILDLSVDTAPRVLAKGHSSGGRGFVTERLRGPRTHSMSAVVALAEVLAPRRRLPRTSARLHSNTSLTRASRVDGTSRPSIFAVLRLIVNSNLLGSWTGRSAGFAPRKMRST